MAEKQENSAPIKVLLVGCGKMGYALLSGWLNSGIKPEYIRVVEPDAASRDRIAKEYKIVAFAGAKNIDSHFKPEAIVFAIKPQVMAEILPDYSGYVGRVLFISIAAGKTLSFLEKHLGSNAAIARVMPNLPATIGRGISAAVFNKKVSETQADMTETLLQAVGEVIGISDESLMDAVTAISGSGPAYVSLFLEALISAGTNLGLSDEDAEDLAKMTLLGSAELLVVSDKAPMEICQEVTSPGGTTEAALRILMARGKGLKEVIEEATAQAAKRSKELAN